ncbi:MAG: ribonuclease HII [Candidatus Aenigmarchaeota archaeon]|nr:ribonuclease HII [Candidatus Aenigmarchaeota archaeon]MDI6721920.1 ribonuclease HII [Candidatus Aenigmarchaeota archaeon]
MGPMVMCGYVISDHSREKLKAAGVKDSKMLSPSQRKEISEKIKKLADDCVVLKISAKEIDSLRTASNLNKIEIERMQEIINKTNPGRVIIDAPESDTKSFRQKILKRVDNEGIEVITENFADKNHPEVGAASIIAKVARDEEIRKLHKAYGNFGSGYTSDERTIRFLKDWIKLNKEFPDIVRKSWVTAELMIKEKQQRKLYDFGK